MINKAILLVGGKGTRLMPLTTSTPKPMLKIAGAPVTEHQIIKAREAGITEIVLATSYLAEVFQPYFGDGSKFGIRISYAFETEPLGTGGAIANAAQQLQLEEGESVFIFNGDVLSAHDLLSQSKLHLESEAAATIHLVEVNDARAYGCVPIDSERRVLQFLEKMENPIANTINAGCYLFTAETIRGIPAGQVVSVERETFPNLLANNETIMGYEDSAYWIDMGTPESMIRASRDLILNPAISPATPKVSGDSLVSPSAQVADSAKVLGGSFIEAGAAIGAESVISGSIIGPDSQIESGVFVENSYIAAGTRVKSGSKLRGEIFGF